MMHGNKPVQRGFTLVEMLVSVTIFSLGMAALLVALRVGIGAWRQTKTAQAREAQLEKAIATMSRDGRQAFRPAEDAAPFSEGEDANGGETLTLTTRLSQRLGYAPPAGHWAEVAYAIKDIDKKTVLVRKVIPHVGAKPVPGAAYEEELIPGARSIQISYLSNQGKRPKWDQPSVWPVAFEILLKVEGAGPCQFTIGLPQSYGK